MLPDCNNSSSLTSSSSSSLRASLSARGGAQARRAQQEGIAQRPPPNHSSTVLVPTITSTTVGRQTGLSVNHGNPSLVDASILQQHHFLPTRTTPTSFFNIGSSPRTTRRNVLRHGDPRRLPLRTPMNCRREIRNAECIGIIEQALLIAASMEDDFCDGDDWMMFDEPNVRRF